ncbi:MAG: phosphate ABC transporter permease PstA [Bdellovibrionota bacterium]
MSNFVRTMRQEVIPSALVWLSFAVVAGVFALVVGDLLWHGAGNLSFSFLTAAPESAGRAGGIGPILVSTILILAICMGATIPIGIGTAILLAEFTSRSSRFGRSIRVSLDVLAGVPSIVFGLFGNALFCKVLGFGFSIVSGGLTLACMALPLFIRSVEEGFRQVPQDYRSSAAALGLSRTSTLRHILIPAAAPGIVVGLILGVGRALAETAALIFTSGYVDRLPESLWDSGRALSVHIFDLSMNVPGGDANAYKAAFVLVVFLLMINGFVELLSARLLSRRIVTT